MGLFQSFDISASGMTAERFRTTINTARDASCITRICAT